MTYTTKSLEKQEFTCDLCNYTCSKKYLFKKHINSKKHISMSNSTNFHQKVKIESDYNCECGKKYKHRQSLYTHKKKCIIINANNDWSAPVVNENIIENNMNNFQDLVIDLMKKNQELQETIIKQQEDHQKEIVDLIPMMGNNITNNINNKFNLNVFLNETCKDALNIQDFIKSLQISFEDLEITREKGLLESVNKQIINNLRSLEVDKRPIHCSDQKRRIMHIKDNNEWQKDDNCEKLKNTIDNIAAKQLSHFNVWEKENPEYMDSATGQNNYVQLVENITKDVDDKETNKIITSIAKEVAI